MVCRLVGSVALTHKTGQPLERSQNLTPKPHYYHCAQPIYQNLSNCNIKKEVPTDLFQNETSQLLEGFIYVVVCLC